MNINKIINKRIAVCCDTEEKVKAFLAECEKAGVKWYDGRNPTVTKGAPITFGYFTIDDHLYEHCYNDVLACGYKIIDYTPSCNCTPQIQSILSIKDFAQSVYETAVNHGWWDKEPAFCEFISLCHSELSEALEEYRNDSPICYYFDNDGDVSTDMAAYKGQELHGIGVELADCIIRILNYCAGQNIDIERLMWLKNEFNKTRSYKHGGKKI